MSPRLPLLCVDDRPANGWEDNRRSILPNSFGMGVTLATWHVRPEPNVLDRMALWYAEGDRWAGPPAALGPLLGMEGWGGGDVEGNGEDWAVAEGHGVDEGVETEALTEEKVPGAQWWGSELFSRVMACIAGWFRAWGRLVHRALAVL